MPIELDSNRKISFAVTLLLFAIVFQVCIIYHVQEDFDSDDENYTHLNADVRSAINRAKTTRCQKELRRYALDQQNETEIVLTRSCPRDSVHVERIIELGCLTRKLSSNSSSSISSILIQEQTKSPSECNELCFSHGHSHAGYNLATQECWCADDLEQQSSESLLFTKKEEDPPECNLVWYRVNNGIYEADKRISQVTPTQRSQQIRIVFLLSLNGRSILQIQRLLKAIFFKKHFYYIHVDSRQQYLQDRLEQLYGNVSERIIFAKRRHETVWGGPSLLTMLIEAMDQMAHLEWDYIINLSETDFPIKNLTSLEDYLGSHKLDSIYLKSHNMKGYNFIKKQGLNYHFYQCEGRVWRLGRRQLPHGIVYSGGSDWVGLPKKFCDFILAERLRKNSLVDSLLHLYNFTLLPAESFFHTLALNSEFCDKYVDNNLRLTNWHRKQGCKCQHKQVVDWCGCSPLVYRWATDWSRLKYTYSIDSLFISRKFDPTISALIIGAVEDQLVIGKQINETEDIDSRYWLNVYESSEKIGSAAYIKFSESALEQIRMNVNSRLKSIDLYFNKDYFVGILLKFCQPEVDNSLSSLQLLIERKPNSNLRRLNNECLKAQDKNLLSLEVSHGFDTGERMFRNLMPLSPSSEIVVHHEWSVARRQDGEPSSSDDKKILFMWIDPNDRVELVQEIKLKVTSKPSHLSLVHRLVHERPLAPGLWRLIVRDDHEDCIEYRFLIIDDDKTSEQEVSTRSPSQTPFDELYKVTIYCFEDDKSQAVDDSQIECSHHNWSLTARNKFQERYELAIDI